MMPSTLRLVCATIALAATMTLVLVGCGGGGGGSAIVALTTFPAIFTARVGDVIGLNAVATYANGNQANITREVIWASSDSAVGDVDASGAFSAQAPGTTEVTASKGAVTSDAINITVVAVPALPTADYFPLVIGYLWRYAGTEVSPGGVRTSQPTVTLIQSVPRQAVSDGTTWFEIQVKGTDPLEPPGYLYMRHDPEGLVRSEYQGRPPVKVLDASLAEGASWAHPEDPRRTFLIESVSEYVEVPAGAYDDCIKVVETDTAYDPPSRIIVWYHHEVGIVWEQVYAGDALESEQKLVSFEPPLP